ncbi:MAG: hypothetical protein COW11_06355 [Candidatus Omnitrophica bacterium CG12_big_fil_rev_8_21_14_0_65_43_15]|uniref:DUF4954 domain-containing protein n=1 Tax=Candidatus Taenaricola geysiri TaxID=1974752 RepID=A0A2J0LIJ3_9BACT|nr:MAG: hypothetical protein AUJ89_02640 [Candidatus Omnitrophica bacterium CG1_02_43_210]PIR65354.1 MAG: hypothetical protein COU52_04725 [Candidatus Omnitrophica bacterium CG10_big_fil_rev_8_21_14_0_10_43_8]PIV12191.1 MAG: hypothetical protein COS48_02100 [Candidatus Omnitrophica bacterium CG03_land_8_20_14_0_80_43_22]PIW65850.1 MAG: hypothetical protein COW11_06355 [Candidatus Omnitrophica bacterium CG12_big_fil_rev_8_21_14_0_65_43_15]PIW80115.1 MAG: hypothetical protein COZ98_04065 [Candida
MQSELINSVSKVKQFLGKATQSAATGKKAEALKPEQIAVLEKNGNFCHDWKKVKVAKNFNPNRVFNCYFDGKVTLGVFVEKIEVSKGIILSSGLYNSKIVDCQIGDNVLISDVKCLVNYVVKEKAVLFNNGIISCASPSVFGNGTEVPIAIETGGREVKLYADITIDEAAKIAGSRHDKKLLAEYEKKISGFVKNVSSVCGIIEEGAVIRNTQKVADTFVGAYAVIDNAVMVKNTTILSNKDEKAEIIDGAYVKNSIIQWGSEVASGAIVDSSCLTEHSRVERHGKVTQSILGPNTGIAEGEVTASLVGPFVGFHHQSLLIAAFWPEGKGNVGYGANVGSNHTSKAPDQEIWPGEGAFFGLGTNIKFPSDFSKSPYTIIASGVNALPQKVTFPFSLINSASLSLDGISPAFNEIAPGWVLSDNIYTIKRNEGKYQKRNKAKRSKFVFEVFRPQIVDLMLDARQRLIDIKFKKNYYTFKDIQGLGKNYLLETDRARGVEAYTFYIRYYALLGLKKKLEELLAGKKSAFKKNSGNVLTLHSKDKRWEHERKILIQELKDKSAVECLDILSQMQEKIARDVQVSKEKDDKRGAKIISDYAFAHPVAADDSFVKQTWDDTKKMQREISALIKVVGLPKKKK